jgi:hypothetical protein
VQVVLGGGTLQTGDAVLHDRVTAGITAVAPRATVAVLEVPPVFGAVVAALTAAGAPAAAVRRARRELGSR